MPRASLYARIREILESARIRVARSVNTTQVVANWLIGREIVEDEQMGKRRAGYGHRILLQLANRLKHEFGDGYGLTNLKLCRKFFLIYPNLVSTSKGHTVRDLLVSPPTIWENQASEISVSAIGHTPCGESWQPGLLHPNLAWSLYRHLIKVDAANTRAFYEIEAVKGCWSPRLRVSA